MYDREPWRQHYSQLAWAQGDHMLISAPTNAGKTTMVDKLTRKRSHVVILASKTKDPAFSGPDRLFRDYTTIHEWPPPQWANRIILKPPKAPTLRQKVGIQREVFRDALDQISIQGNWCVVIDETHWITSREFCNLGPEVAILHHEGRTSGISMVDLTQRPAWIPKIIYSSVTHAYVARTRDADDLRRLSDLGGIDMLEVRKTVPSLPTRHDYLYVSPQTDALPRIVNTRK